MTKRADEDRQILIQIAESIKTINHSSETTSAAIVDMTNQIKILNERTDNTNKQLIKLIGGAFIILGALVGVKLYLP